MTQPEKSSLSPVQEEAPTLDISELIEAVDRAAQDYAWERELGPAAIEKAQLDKAKAELAAAFRGSISERETLRAELEKRDARMFPIRRGPAIPWSAIARFDEQAQQNHGGQTLERLAQRGGLSPHEAIHVMRCAEWRGPESEAIQRLSLSDAITAMNELVASGPEAAVARLSSEKAALSDQLAESMALQAQATSLVQQLSASREQAIQDIEALPSMRVVNMDNREVIARDEVRRILREAPTNG